jgi:aspartyl protease family protein
MAGFRIMLVKMTAMAVVATLSAVGAAQTVILLEGQMHPDRPVQMASAVAQPQAPAIDARSAQIVKAPDGHYWAEANVSGHAVRFLVDTGASAVALTADDARRLGFAPSTLNYGYTVQTANGVAHAARVTLPSVSIAGARVDNVEAFVIDHGLETSLLGMTYLGRLSRFEATPNALILHR